MLPARVARSTPTNVSQFDALVPPPPADGSGTASSVVSTQPPQIPLPDVDLGPVSPVPVVAVPDQPVAPIVAGPKVFGQESVRAVTATCKELSSQKVTDMNDNSWKAFGAVVLQKEKYSLTNLEGSYFERYMEAVKRCSTASAALGFTTAGLAEWPLDKIILGTGSDGSGGIDPTAEGILGTAVQATSIVLAAGGEGVGTIIGGGIGLATRNSAPAIGQEPGQYVTDARQEGASLAARGTGRLVATPGAVAVNLARGASAASKVSVAGIFAFTGGLFSALLIAPFAAIKKPN